MNGDSYKYIRFDKSQETRWANRSEIEKSSTCINLNDDNYNASGLPLLSDGNVAFVDDSDTHSLIFGSTGSKKTRLFCMPMVNIFAKAGESFIVTDPKGEIYAQTSGLVKEKGYKTIVLNFRDIGKGDMWNPLSLPYELWHNGFKDEAGILLSDFISTIADKQTSNTKDAFWPEAAQAIATANLYVLMESAKKEQVNVISFAKMSTMGSVRNLKTLNSYLDNDSVPSLNYSSTIAISADNTISGMMSSLGSMLRVFTMNRKLSMMLSNNTFDMRKFGREKTAVYIIVPDEKTTYHFLVTTFVKQVYEILISEAQKEKNRQLPIRVNFVLDEFCNIPKIPDMPSMISAARSRNMRFYLIAQSIHQLKSKYGEDSDTIKGNCDNWIFLTSKELALLNEISELCGNITTPEGRIRRLISVSELQRLSKERGETLIMHTRQYPIITEMADISSYKMFGTHKACDMKTFDMNDIETFSLRKLLNDVKDYNAVAPFASKEHLLAQCCGAMKNEYEQQLYGTTFSDKNEYYPIFLKFINGKISKDELFEAFEIKTNNKHRLDKLLNRAKAKKIVPLEDMEEEDEDYVDVHDEDDFVQTLLDDFDDDEEDEKTQKVEEPEKDELKADFVAFIDEMKKLKVKVKERIVALVGEDFAKYFFEQDIEQLVKDVNELDDFDF